MPLRLASWNLFHGRSQPATHADLIRAFADGLASRPWDVCGLQEAPPWWSHELGIALGASVRGVRTALLRSLLPGVQERVHRRDPERLGVSGAGANVLLVRPSAGEIVDHRQAVLRVLPLRRTVHAVRLRRPDGSHCWVANAHTHNRPESLAAADLIKALGIVDRWAGAAGADAGPRRAPEPVVLLGDLNLHVPQGLVRVEGYEWLYGQRVDHVVGRGFTAAGGSYADRIHGPGGAALSDHRFVGVTVERRD